jgi:hypothetical protein
MITLIKVPKHMAARLIQQHPPLQRLLWYNVKVRRQRLYPNQKGTITASGGDDVIVLPTLGGRFPEPAFKKVSNHNSERINDTMLIA